jgi:hypothetical protein
LKEKKKMVLSFFKKIALAGLIGLMGIMATTSDADAWGGRRHHHRHYHGGGGGGIGPGIGLGLLGGLAVGAAIASQPRYYAPQQYYYGHQPVYHRQYRPRKFRCVVTRYDAYGYPYRQRTWCRR